jgi:tRNA pseudouridine55 synthase
LGGCDDWEAEGIAGDAVMMNSGIHLVHKPVGPTSFSVVQEFLKSLTPAPGARAKKICHGGTLDPFAHGLLLILVEPATRLFDYLHAIPKTYVAMVKWGTETDNGDPNGKVVFSGDAGGLGAEKLEEALKGFLGWQEQVPHATSAKRIDGERAYVKSHRGEEVVMPASRVYLHEASWLSHDLPRSSQLKMTVRGGYYVRALARDLGKLVGCGAHLSELHRTQIGPWADPGEGGVIALAGRDILPWAGVRILSDADVGELRKWEVIPRGEVLAGDWELPAGFPDPEGPVRGFHRDKFCFVLKGEGETLKMVAPLRGGI